MPHRRRFSLVSLARWELLIFVMLVATVCLGASLSGEFLTGANLGFLTQDVMEIALIALPLTLLIISGEIDLSVASVLGLVSALMGAFWNAGWPMEAIIPVVLVVGALAGLVNGLLVTRLGLPSLAVTIGTLALYRGLAWGILGDKAVADFPSSYTNLGMGYVGGTRIPYTLILFIVLAIVFGVLLRATPLGRSIYAIGSSEETAFFSGIRVKRIKLLLFTLTGLVAGLAGIVWTLRFASARPDNGMGLELSVIAAVLLGGVSIFGGRGALLPVIAAVFLIGGLRNALTLDDVSDDMLTLVTGVLLIFSVLAPNLAQRLRELLARRRAAAAIELGSEP
jgi:rhamnose transport system permease protein